MISTEVTTSKKRRTDNEGNVDVDHSVLIKNLQLELQGCKLISFREKISGCSKIFLPIFYLLSVKLVGLLKRILKMRT